MEQNKTIMNNQERPIAIYRNKYNWPTPYGVMPAGTCSRYDYENDLHLFWVAGIQLPIADWILFSSLGEFGMFEIIGFHPPAPSKQ